MNLNELRETWKNLHQTGLEAHSETDIQNIISYGTTRIVRSINQKLFRDMAVTALATIISAFGILFFYILYVPSQHPWIDVSKFLPIQIIALVIFLVLFAFGWFEYKLVNRKFTTESLKEYISSVLGSIHKCNRLFTGVVLPLLFGAFFLELDYFILQEGQIWLMIKVAVSILLTIISYAVMRQYYKKSLGSYLADLSRYHKELKG